MKFYKLLLSFVIVTNYLFVFAGGGTSTGPCTQSNTQATIVECINCTVNDGSAPGTLASDGALTVTAIDCGPVTLRVRYQFDWVQGPELNWLHGISFNAGSLWTSSSFTPPSGWVYMPDGVTGECSGQSYGPGYYYDGTDLTSAPQTITMNFVGPGGCTSTYQNSQYNTNPCNAICSGNECLWDEISGNCAGTELCDIYTSLNTSGGWPNGFGANDGDPGNNWGTDCTNNCPDFYFDLTFCPSGGTPSNYSETVSLQSSADGESGAWCLDGNCDIANSFNISILNACGPDAGTNGTITTCATGDPVDLYDQLGGTPSTAGSWSGGLSGGYLGTYDPTALSPGSYIYTVGVPTCFDDAIVTVTEIAAPIPNAGPDQTICQGQTVTIGNDPVYNVAGFPYSWDNGAGSGVLDLSGGGQDHGTASVTPATTTTYTLTVGDPTCFGTDQVTITVTPPVTPTFNAVGPYCQNFAAPALPTTSTNGITGTWSPALSTATLGTTTYTFTPSAGQCAVPTTMNITITTPITPTFNPVGPYCQNFAAPALPTTSTNGISGTWSPALSTATVGTQTYTFTPTAGQCATTTTLSITITAPITPTFNAVGPYCQNFAAPALPTTSTNGITGTWSPAISTATVGTQTYTFTPTAGQCAAQTTLNITITNPIVPTFNSVAAVCQNDPAPVLPTTSTNGINGTWSPAVSTATAGTTTYTFTPTAGQCATTTTLSITVNAPTLSTFNAVGPFCIGTGFTLPASSIEGFSGSWSPAINTTATTTYTFTPTAGQCAAANSLTVTINPEYNITEDVSVCENDTYTYPDGSSATITGNTSYTSNLTTAAGCDSIIVTNVTMNPIYNIVENIEACENSSVTYPDGSSETITASTSHTSNLTTAAGCDSIIVTNVTMRPVYTIPVDASVCSGASYTFPDGTIHTNITADETYTSNFSSVYGCDSIIVTNLTISTVFTTTENFALCTGSDYTFPDGTLHTNITANESYVSTLPSTLGCDSLITTNITINPDYNLTEDVAVCENDTYTYPDGSSATIIGNTSYTSNLTTSAGCDSIIVTNVTMNPIYNIVEDIEACENSSVTYPDGSSETITASTSHTSNLTTAAGCDSIIVTNVTMNPVYSSTVDASICSGDSYTFPDGTIHTNITVNESYTSNLTSVSSCDSIIITNITINPVFATSEEVTLCTGSDYTFPDGVTHTNITASESYVSTLASIMGCDSLVTTNVTINPDYNITENVSVCENETYTYPDGTTATITASTSYTSSLTTTAGCDSIIVTNVTMNPVYNITEDVDACENSSVTYPDGTSEMITASTSHTSSLTTTAGCDSIIVTNVTMVTNYLVTEDVAICQGDDYTFPDGTIHTNISVNESYTSNLVSSIGCDSAVVTNVNVNSTYAVSETFAICSGSDYVYPDGTTHTNITTDETYVSSLLSVAGCDSIVTTNINVNPVYNLTEDISICENESISYPDGSSETITASTSHTSNLITSTGCDSIIVTNVSMNPVYNIAESFTICFGEDYTYPDGTIHTNITVGESYTSTFASVDGCDSIIVTTVSINPNPDVSMSSSDVLCNGDGSATAVVNNAGTFDFVWSNLSTASGTTSTISNLTQGWYYVITSDQSTGCTSYDSVEVISSPVTITISVSDLNGSCVNATDGNISVSVANGTMPYVYTWGDIGVGGPDRLNLAPGNYDLLVEDDLGCSSTATITVPGFPIYNQIETLVVCENSSVTYPDGTTETITSSTSHTSNLMTVEGCDSIIVTNVTMNPVYNLTEAITVCENEMVTYPDGTTETISVSTSHTSYLTTVAGCDSTIVTNVSMNPVYALTESILACENSSVTYPDGTSETITSSTSHTSNLTTAAGCDSTIVTNVTMNPVYALTVNIEACENSSVTYPDGNSATITASTSYTSNLTTVAGCDSIIVTNVTMNPIYNLSETIEACENSSVTYPDGTTATITASTSYTSSLTTASGCDSIIVTNVTMNPVYTLSEDLTICEGTTITYPDGTTQTISASTSHVSNLSSVSGCDSTITTNVTMTPLPNAGQGSSLTLCADDAPVDMFTLLGAADTGGTWSPMPASGSSVIDPAVDSEGVYSYSVTNTCATDNAQITVTIIQLPNPGQDNNVTLCFDASSIDLFSYLGSDAETGGTWSPMPASGTSLLNPQLDASGAYVYSLSNSCGTYSAQVDVTVTPLDDPSFSYGISQICENSTNPTAVVSGLVGGTFSINNGGTINSATGEIDLIASGPGTYVITYTTNGPCTNSTTQSVQVLPNADATINPEGVFCEYDGAVQLVPVEGGGTWSGTGVDATSGVFNPAAATIGDNVITYTIGGMCGDQQSIVITVNPAPFVQTIEDTTIALGASIELLTESNGSTITWSPTEYLDCSDCLIPTSTPEMATTYIVTSELNGCISQDIVTINIEVVPYVFIPNIFSPNGDGNNDVLYVRAKGVQSLEFRVFDRWGELVFESTSMDSGWDGVFRGQKMNAAVFVYTAKVIFIDGQELSVKGDVTLVR